MKTVRSKDGTSIAYDQTGSGPAAILVNGAFSYRNFPGALELAELLSPHFTVINYDRRGRGDSGDTQPYAVEREIEDLDALIQAAGGSAYVWGLSSGAVLALKAADCGLNITKLVLYDPAMRVSPDDPLPPADFIQHVTDLITQDKRGEAVRYFMTKGMGAPGFVVTMMRFMPGVWPRLTAVANTLPYDARMVDGYMNGKPLPAGTWKNITMPTLVLDGEKAVASIRNAAQAVAKILPNAQHRTLPGLSHTNIDMKVIAPVVVEFLSN
ncbi:MAG: alpha/beta hydrolase [Chloroflexota bacterium]